jgi:hypothetical protein
MNYTDKWSVTGFCDKRNSTIGLLSIDFQKIGNVVPLAARQVCGEI